MKPLNKIKVGIAGSAGYTGGELIRILLNHSSAEIVSAQSRRNAGRLVSDVHADLFGETWLKFSATISGDIDLLFLCMGHGESAKFLSESRLSDRVKIIDLSQDFRTGSDFIYGLPELNRQKISSASRIANPGCFA